MVTRDVAYVVEIIDQPIVDVIREAKRAHLLKQSLMLDRVESLFKIQGDDNYEIVSQQHCSCLLVI